MRKVGNTARLAPFQPDRHTGPSVTRLRTQHTLRQHSARHGRTPGPAAKARLGPPYLQDTGAQAEGTGKRHCHGRHLGRVLCQALDTQRRQEEVQLPTGARVPPHLPGLAA